MQLFSKKVDILTLRSCCKQAKNCSQAQLDEKVHCVRQIASFLKMDRQEEESGKESVKKPAGRMKQLINRNTRTRPVRPTCVFLGW